MKDKFIRSCLNYTGGKFKLLPQIFPLFPDKINNFTDLFAGGGVVGINMADKYDLFNSSESKFILNDIEPHVIELFKLLKAIDHNELIEKIEEFIRVYELSNTTKYGYDFYGVDSSTGLGLYNKEKYANLRNDYNLGKFEGSDRDIVFYILVVYGFNNQIRFNGKGEYNLPVGKRDFNANMRRKLKEFQETLNNHEFLFENKDFREMIDFEKDDFIYCDPPYRITTATYNENGGWNLKDDLALFDYLDKANDAGAKFALSNVAVHNNLGNDELIHWSNKYTLHILDYHYNNSNYQSKAKQSSTVEVLITNY